MEAVERDANRLQEHMSQTYANLRVGIAVIGLALPVLLSVGGGVLFGVPLLGSMSEYYRTEMRDVFVGALIAIGLFLYLYKGFSNLENWALNAAGVLAVAVALFPTGEDWRGTVHNVSAIAFFFCIAYVAIFRAGDTLDLMDDPAKAKKLAVTYRWIGVAMIASPLIAAVLSYFNSRRSFTFTAEAVAVAVFSIYWIFKTVEIGETGAEQLALEAKIEKGPEEERLARVR